MKMSPNQNDRSKWLRELTINAVTIDRYSQAADTSDNSVVNFKPPNQVTQIRNTFILPEQKREFAAEVPFIVYKKRKNFPGNIAFTEKHAHQS